MMLLRESVIVIGMALLLSLLVKTWLMQAFYIPSESMEDTLLKGDRVIVSKPAFCAHPPRWTPYLPTPRGRVTSERCRAGPEPDRRS